MYTPHQSILIYSTKDARDAILGQMADNLNASFEIPEDPRAGVSFSGDSRQLFDLLGCSETDHIGPDSHNVYFGRDDYISEWKGRERKFGDIVRLELLIECKVDWYGNAVDLDIEEVVNLLPNVLKGISCAVDVYDCCTGCPKYDSPLFHNGQTNELAQVKFSPDDLRHANKKGFAYDKHLIHGYRANAVAALCSRLLFGKCDHVDPPYFASLVADNDVEKITAIVEDPDYAFIEDYIEWDKLFKKGHFDGAMTILRLKDVKRTMKQPGLLLAHFVALDDIDSVEVILDKVSIGKRSKTGICKELRKYPDNASKQLVIDRLELPEEEARYDDPNLRDPLEPVKPCAGYFEAETQYLGVRVTLKDGTVLKDGTIDYWQYIGVKATKQRNEARQKLFGLCKTGNDVVRALCVMFPTSTEWVKTVKTANRPLEKEAFCGLLGDVARGLKAVESVDQIDNIVALGRTYGPDFSVTTDIDPQLDTFYEPTCFDDGGVSGWSAIDMYDDFTENAWDLKWDFTTGECVYDKG